jgi:hypothetical protein
MHFFHVTSTGYFIPYICRQKIQQGKKGYQGNEKEFVPDRQISDKFHSNKRLISTPGNGIAVIINRYEQTLLPNQFTWQ